MDFLHSLLWIEAGCHLDKIKRNAEDAKFAEEDAEQVKRLISSAPLSANFASSAFRLK